LSSFAPKKLHSQTVSREKLHSTLSNEKAEHEMLMKLTPVVHIKDPLPQKN